MIAQNGTLPPWIVQFWMIAQNGTLAPWIVQFCMIAQNGTLAPWIVQFWMIAQNGFYKEKKKHSSCLQREKTAFVAFYKEKKEFLPFYKEKKHFTNRKHIRHVSISINLKIFSLHKFHKNNFLKTIKIVEVQFLQKRLKSLSSKC